MAQCKILKHIVLGSVSRDWPNSTKHGRGSGKNLEDKPVPFPPINT